MARMTKAEKMVAWEAEQVRLAKQAEESYLPRLMTALETAHQFNYAFFVQDGFFCLRDRDSSWDEELRLSPVYTAAMNLVLENLEFDLERKAAERAVELARLAKKEAALNKLTKEERELLGLQ